MSTAIPDELNADIKQLRIMATIIAICGLITILGIPWALLYITLAITLRRDKLPIRSFLIFTAIVTFPICLFIVPLPLEIGLWRLANKTKSYEVNGKKGFKSNKEMQFVKPWRKYALLRDLIILLAVFIIMLLPIPHINSVAVELPYKTQYIQDSNIELGESQIRQPGDVGQGQKQSKQMKPIFAYILGINAYYEATSLPTKTTQPPTNQITAQGTKKYQYMWCSNGGYRYFTNEQFSNPNVGFTHKSPDGCAQNGQGHMTGLADTAPPQQTTRTVYAPSPISTPSYTTCHEYSFMNEFSCTTY